MEYFIHLADLHIGSSRYIPNYLQRWIDAHNFIINYAKKLQPKYILCAGDIVEKDLTEQERVALISWFIQLDSIAEVFVVAGNHDAINDNISQLSLLSALVEKKKLKNTYIAEFETKTIIRENASFILIPGYSPNFVESISSNLASIDTSKPLIIIGHERDIEAYNAVSDILAPLEHIEKKKAGNSPIKGISLNQKHYIALGDIHCFLKTGEKNLNCYYSGPTLQQKFSDVSQGFFIVSMDSLQPQFVPIPVSELITVEETELLDENMQIREAYTNKLIRLLCNEKSPILSELSKYPSIIKVKYKNAQKEAIRSELLPSSALLTKFDMKNAIESYIKQRICEDYPDETVRLPILQETLRELDIILAKTNF